MLLAAGLGVAMSVLLIGSVTGWITNGVPGSLGARAADNSEAYVIVLVLASWIQFVRPRISGTPVAWPLTAVVAGVCFAIGYFLWDIGTINGGTHITTLNEGFFDLALLLPYVMLRRPLPRRVPWVISIGTLVLTVLLYKDPTVVDLAEVIGCIVLMPIALDVVDAGILDPDARTVPTLRYAWYGFLVLVPLAFAGIRSHQPVVPAGGFAEAIRYLVRPNEDFIATLVICVYFAVLLGRTGASARQRTGQAAPAEVPVGASTSVYASTAVTAAAAGTGTAAATDAGTAATAGETRRRG